MSALASDSSGNREVEVRAARPDEEDAALRLIYTPPGVEAIGLAGSEGRALAFGGGLHQLGLYRDAADDLLVALEGGRPVGILLGRTGEGSLFDWTRAPALISLAVRVFPLAELPRFLRRGWMRSRLDFPLPRPSFHISEIHVEPACRGRGIGGLLLDAAERTARERGLPRLSLTTLMTNPARRLYERMGFGVTDERTVKGYETLTDSPGRVLMEKRLEAEAEPIR